MLTRTQATSIFGSVKALQAALGLKTHSAIYMWPPDSPIPAEHALRIRYELRPDAFDASGQIKPERGRKRTVLPLKRPKPMPRKPVGKRKGRA